MNFIEKMIAKRVAAALIKAHGSVVVDGERGYDPEAPRFRSAAKAVEEMDKFDECHVFVGGSHKAGYDAYVYFIWGNGNGGWDCMSDWITSLDTVLQPTLDWIEKESD